MIFFCINKMETIKYLNEHGIDKLSSNGIKIKYVQDKNVWILNYQQDLPKGGFDKFHPVVCECRNLIVRKCDEKWYVISQSFTRFFNWTEDPDATEDFKLQMLKGNVMATEKFDGSLITVTYFDNNWHIFTRGADADSNIFRGMSLVDIDETFGFKVRKFLNLDLLHKKITYIFELCTGCHNVTQYDGEFLALISANMQGKEFYGYSLRDLSRKFPPSIKTPDTFYPRSIDDVHSVLKTKSDDFEGYVLSYSIVTDGIETNKYVTNNIIKRMKLKQLSYVNLHFNRTIKTNPSIEDLLNIVGKNEISEYIAYYPNYKPILIKLQNIFTENCNEIDNFMASNNSRTDKDFASSVQKKQFNWVYFNLRKQINNNAWECIFDKKNVSKITGYASKIINSANNC